MSSRKNEMKRLIAIFESAQPMDHEVAERYYAKSSLEIWQEYQDVVSQINNLGQSSLDQLKAGTMLSKQHQLLGNNSDALNTLEARRKELEAVLRYRDIDSEFEAKQQDAEALGTPLDNDDMDVDSGIDNDPTKLTPDPMVQKLWNNMRK